MYGSEGEVEVAMPLSTLTIPGWYRWIVGVAWLRKKLV
jgi:hypothetical protein